MSINNFFLLKTWLRVDDRGFYSGCTFSPLQCETLKQDKAPSGEILQVQDRTDFNLILHYRQDFFGDRIDQVEQFSDSHLAERIIRYMQDYHGRRHTNCSTLAEYLRTGTFSDCLHERNGMMFFGAMDPYTDQVIHRGDSFCMLYYGKYGCGTWAPAGMQRHYAQNLACVHGDFTRLVAADFTLPDQPLHELSQMTVFHAYHFFSCIGIHQGQPVFIHQIGKNECGLDIDQNPVVISIGAWDITGWVPAFVFINQAG